MSGKSATATLLALVAVLALSGSASASVTNTRITSGPSGTVTSGSATFTFTSPEGNRFQCRLDDAEWEPCSSPQTYEGLADGRHTFKVRAVNWAGHPDPTPACWTFTVETPVPVPPETSIVSGPSGTIVVDFAIFAFESDQPGTFECRLDSVEESAWAPCESPQLYSDLLDGEHGFEVRAVNEGGEPDPTPAARTFTTNTVPPEPSEVIPPGPPRPEAGKTFNVEPVEGTVELECPGESAYSRLTSFKQVPMGCLVNTRRGTIALTSSKGSSGELQNAHFWGGVFVVGQKEGDNQQVELKLAGKRMCEKRGPHAARGMAHASRSRRSRRGGRRAWGSGKGNYTTSGSYGSATVRGTTWLVVDRCDASTLIKVAEGTVWARDFLKEKTVVLTEGQQYIAKAPIPRLNPKKFP